MSSRYFEVKLTVPEYTWLKANIGRSIKRVQNMMNDPKQEKIALKMAEGKQYKSLNRLAGKMDQLVEEESLTQDEEGNSVITLKISRTQGRFIQGMCDQIGYQMDEKVIPEYQKRVKDSVGESVKNKSKKYLAGAKGVRNIISEVKRKVDKGI